MIYPGCFWVFSLTWACFRLLFSRWRSHHLGNSWRRMHLMYLLALFAPIQVDVPEFSEAKNPLTPAAAPPTPFAIIPSAPRRRSRSRQPQDTRTSRVSKAESFINIWLMDGIYGIYIYGIYIYGIYIYGVYIWYIWYGIYIWNNYIYIYIWNNYIYMEYIWYIYIYMDYMVYIWNNYIYGIYMVYIYIYIYMVYIYMVYIWYIYGIHIYMVWYIWYIYMVYMVYMVYMDGIYGIYG